jgi:hypothetical protein
MFESYHSSDGVADGGRIQSENLPRPISLLLFNANPKAQKRTNFNFPCSCQQCLFRLAETTVHATGTCTRMFFALDFTLYKETTRSVILTLPIVFNVLQGILRQSQARISLKLDERSHEAHLLRLMIEECFGQPLLHFSKSSSTDLARLAPSQ